MSAVGDATAAPSPSPSPSPAPAPPASSSSSAPTPSVHYPVKWVIDEHGRSIPVCMQNENGPCAMLALINASLILCDASLPAGTTRLQETEIMSVLADHVSRSAERAKDAGNKERQAARQYAVGDFLDLLPTLNKGLDVNVRFDSPLSFEFTRQLSVFDVFPNVRLVHGWLVDPQDTRLMVTLSEISYNQLVDELVRTQHAPSGMTHQGSAAATAPPPEAFEASAPPPPPPPEPQPEPKPLDSDTVAHSASDAQRDSKRDSEDDGDVEMNTKRDADVEYDEQADIPVVPFAHLSMPHYDDDTTATPTATATADDETMLNENATTNTDTNDDDEIETMTKESATTINIREMRPEVMEFLESNPTQLTVYGLVQLHSLLTEGETAILFRNSHFHVLRKKGGEIFTLITDVGFLNELNIVWERLCDVTGDTTFYNGAFKRLNADGTVQQQQSQQAIHQQRPVQRTGPPSRPAPNAAAVPTQSMWDTSATQSSAATSAAQAQAQAGTTWKKMKSKSGCAVQ